MRAIKSSLLLFAVVALTACANNALANKASGKKMCTRENCTTDPNCQCWCSVKCGYRDKTSADRPMYVDNDSNGKFCYCKQWDLDYYRANCIEGKNIKQQPGAQ